MSQPTIWTKVRVRWDFVTKLCGSVPADPDLMDLWVKSRAPKVKPPNARSLSEINEEVLTTLAEPTEEELGGLLVFQRVNGVCVMRAATIKAHIKDCARVLSNQYVGRITGERAFSTRVINGVYVDPVTYWIPILHQADGTPASGPDGEFDKAVHVRTPQGNRSAIKTIHFVNDARLEFTLCILTSKGNKPSVSHEDLEVLFQYGGVHGYAGERGDGEGRYLYTLESFEGGNA